MTTNQRQRFRRNLDQSLWVTATGEIVHHPENPQSVVIVDEDSHEPLLSLSEVSDGGVVNLFIQTSPDSSGIVKSEEAGMYELLASRKNL
jgi:hypothetical protein